MIWNQVGHLLWLHKKEIFLFLNLFKLTKNWHKKLKRMKIKINAGANTIKEI